MKTEMLDVGCEVVQLRLEIRDEATGQVKRVVTADKKTNQVWAENADGSKEYLGAFE